MMASVQSVKRTDTSRELAMNSQGREPTAMPAEPGPDAAARNNLDLIGDWLQMRTCMKKYVCVILAVLFCEILGGYGQVSRLDFIVITDPQFGMYTADKSFAQETANYEFVVAGVNRLKPTFAIVLGDLVNKAGDPAQTREYWRISRKVDRSILLYHVAGNHDLGNEPTPASLAAYRRKFGRDYYSFRSGPVYGIVLDSPLIYQPKNAMQDYQEQDSWLRKELAIAKASSAQETLIFMHHPMFTKDAREPDQYENLPLERRGPMLELFRRYGIRHVFAGHTHKNVVAGDGMMEITASGPVGKPLGQDGSGIRIVQVTSHGMAQAYYDFGSIPPKLDGLQIATSAK
jgi:serine/threonine-protein phosphatase CPPED1